MIGKTIKQRYKIYDKVGSGGVATVYIARDLQTYEVVAVKLLKTEFTENPNYTKRFMREAEVVSNLHHPNITAVRDYGKEDDQYYMVMEYVEGKMLSQIVEERGAMAYPDAIDVIKQTLSALQYAWENGIVAHRDIKPQNIMLDKNGKVKVMDFGIARVSTSHTMTQAGTFLGTPYYMSPEQAQGKETDIRSDIYSLGITLYQLITGRVPFDADTPWSVVNMHITQAPPCISIPQPYDRLCHVIDKALAKLVQERYQTPQEMLMELDYILQESQAGFSQPAMDQVGEISIQTTPPGAKVWINHELKGITPTIIRNLPPKKVKVILEKEGYKTEEKTCSVVSNQRAILDTTLKQVTAPISPPSQPIMDKNQTMIGNNFQNQATPYAHQQAYPPAVPKQPNTKLFMIIGASLLAVLLAGFGILFLNQNKSSVGKNQSDSSSATPITPTTPVVASSAQIIVNSVPSGGEIYLNGRALEQKTPFTITDLKAGSYEVIVYLEGEKLTQQILLNNGDKKSLHFEKTVVLEAVLEISSEPSGANIKIDNQDTGLKTPNQIKDLQGIHDVMLTLAGYETYTTTVNISGKTEVKATLIPAKTPVGKLSVTSNPAQANVKINNQHYGLTPVDIPLVPGKYKLEITKEGYQTYSAEVEVKQDQTTAIQATLTKTPVSPPKPPPTTPAKEWSIAISSTPSGAKIYLNNQASGQVTPATIKFKPGKYTVKVTLNGYKEQSKTVTFTNDPPASTKIQFTLEKITVTPPPPTTPKVGVLWILSVPDGAEVFVNNVFKGVTPLRLDNVNAGNYTVKVVMNGYETQTKTVTVTGGQTNKQTFTLKKTASKPGTLKITTVPEGAEVYIDGILVGISNHSFTITEGTHKVLIRLEGYQDYVVTITVKSGEVKALTVTLKEK
ncbi:PEGA domain-containing protein [bacterium]|nr:PEGA domain-containing protein [bacterium]